MTSAPRTNGGRSRWIAKYLGIPVENTPRQARIPPPNTPLAAYCFEKHTSPMNLPALTYAEKQWTAPVGCNPKQAHASTSPHCLGGFFCGAGLILRGGSIGTS
jgi:hypothetical protein